MAQKLGKAFAVDSTFSTSALAAPLFAAAALDHHVLGAYRLGETVMASVQIDVPAGSGLLGKSVLDAEQALAAAVVGLRRAGQPASHKFARSERLGPGDALICHVAVDEIPALKTRAAR